MNRLTALFAFLILLPALSPASQPVTPADLKILQWNLYMLPSPFKKSLQSLRAKVIADQLANSETDVMFFQEAFFGISRKAIISELGSRYPYNFYLGADGKLTHIFGSGVFIMSRYPFQVLDKTYFKKCGGFDCFAAKGSVLIETTLPNGRKFQFASTHLQSGDKRGNVRMLQLAQIRAMMDRHKTAGVPQMLIGDLNIIPTEPEFKNGLAAMRMRAAPLTGPIQYTSGRHNDCYKVPGHTTDWIDHAWMNLDAGVKTAAMRARDFGFSYKNKRCPSSDHYAVETRLVLAGR